MSVYDILQLEKYENLWFSRTTGEAVARFPAPEIDDPDNPMARSMRKDPAWCDTKLFFEPVTQKLPTTDAPDGPMFAQKISPWAFAQKRTAQEVLLLLTGWLGGIGATAASVVETNNDHYPYSHPMRKIVVLRDERKAEVNAGLVARAMISSSRFDEAERKMVRQDQLVIQRTIEEISRELSSGNESTAA